MILLDFWCNFLVYLLVGTVFNGRAYAEYNEFGCMFENDQYKLRAPEPIWNKLPRIEYWKLPNQNQYTEFNLDEDLQEIFKEVMEESILNDVDQFIEFLQEYKNKTPSKFVKQDLLSFFRDYTVPFRPQTDSAGIVIEVFRRLKLKIPEAANHMYLITAYVNPNNISIDELNQPRRGVDKNLTKGWFQEHVAGVIKFESNLTSGYLLLDPLYSFGSVKLLRESNGYKWKPDGYNSSTYSKNFFEFTWSKNPFSVAEKKGIGSPGDKHIVYHVEKQYCSFMDSTTKGALLLPEHKIEKRNAMGFSEAYLIFGVYQEQIFNANPYFTVGVYDSSVTGIKGRFEEERVTFKDVQQGNISQNARTIIAEISVHLKIKEDVIISKMTTLQEVLFQHKILLQELIQLRFDTGVPTGPNRVR